MSIHDGCAARSCTVCSSSLHSLSVPSENLLSQLQQSLAGRYEIERPLGRGGMATVYLARDVKHHRHVALKVLDAELGASLGTDRFLAEIRVTANMQHPNVLPLFDSGESEGQLFYVMPYVAGETLRAMLDREGKLPIDQALRIAGAIASALDYAHRHGVVHRDIKPENVLLSDGVPIVADFGIAKAVSLSRKDGGDTMPGMTQTGLALGTPSYMSPEQAMGETVDGRSDVYALGCMLYEMLSGDVPFTGPSAQAVIAKHITMTVPSVREARTSVPVNVDLAIARAMAKEPTDRFTNPAQFAAALTSAPPVEPMPDYSRVTEPVTRFTAPIAGRQRELTELMARLDALGSDRGGFVLLGGEPGVGKTRLAEAVLTEARRRGWFCAVGHCYEMEGSPPYLPFLELLEYIARVVPPGRFRQLLGSGAGELAVVMPVIRQMYSDIPAAVELPPDQQRRFFFSRMLEYLERSSHNLQLVLLFDDLHWADESTLLLLEHLAAHLPQLRILFVGTYRDVDLEVARPFARTLERLTRQRLAERVIVRRMPEQDVAELLATLGAPDPPAALVSAIFRETEGNPFFVEEVFQHLREEGRVLDADGHWLPDVELDGIQVPEGVRLVIGRRLARVSADCLAVLTAAAVIGPRFTIAVLDALGEFGADAVLDALEEAEGASLVLSQAAGRETRYSFSHELIRQTLLAGLSMPRRQRRHQKTADAIERAFAGKLEAHTSDLAYHLYQAGAAIESERTTRVLLLAARQAITAGAFNEALSQVEKALSILETSGDLRHAELLRARGESLRGLGRWGPAIDALDEALALFEALGASDETLAVIFAMSDLLLWTLSDHTRSSELLERALAILPDTARAMRVALLVRAGYSHGMVSGGPAGLPLIEEGLRLARELGDPVIIAEALGARGVHHSTYLRVTDAIEDLAQAYPVLEKGGHRWEAIRFEATYLRQLLIAGRDTEMLARLPVVTKNALDLGHLGAWFLVDQTSAHREWCRHGNVAAFERFARGAAETWASLGPWVTAANVYLAIALHEGGACDDPSAVIASGGLSMGNEAWTDFAWAEYFVMSAETHPQRALAILDAHLDRLPASAADGSGGTGIAVLRAIRGLAMLGEHARSAALYDLSVDILRMGSAIGINSVVECDCGIAAAAGKQWDKAETHFNNALHVTRTAPHVPAEADVLHWHAWMLLQRRSSVDVERAVGMLRECVALCERVGLPRRARRAAEMLRDSTEDRGTA